MPKYYPKILILLLISIILIIYFFLSIYYNLADKHNKNIISLNTNTESKKTYNTNSLPTIDTKYFKARIGTFWELSGYQKIQGGNGVNNINEISEEKISTKLTVSKIQKLSDGYKLEVANSKSGENEEWLISDTEFFKSNESTYIKFPLFVGNHWLDKSEDNGNEEAQITKNRADGFYQYQVNEKSKNKSLNEDCYNISYKTNPGNYSLIFCNNVGVIKEAYQSNGTVYEYQIELTKYTY